MNRDVAGRPNHRRPVMLRSDHEAGTTTSRRLSATSPHTERRATVHTLGSECTSIDPTRLDPSTSQLVRS